MLQIKNSGPQFKKGDVITIKNTLGEEIICTFVEEDATALTITDAWALGMTQKGMSLQPPVVSANMSGEMKFPRLSVMWALPTDEQFIPGYKQQVTGIEIVAASTKIIT